MKVPCMSLDEQEHHRDAGRLRRSRTDWYENVPQRSSRGQIYQSTCPSDSSAEPSEDGKEKGEKEKPGLSCMRSRRHSGRKLMECKP